MAEQNKVDRSKMTVSDEVVVSMDAVNKWYGSFHVLRDINLEVNKGERIVICGPSGSGKSTLIRCLNMPPPPSVHQCPLSMAAVYPCHRGV